MNRVDLERELIGEGEDHLGLLDHHFMGQADGVIYWLCKRCPNGHVHITARDLDGKQTDLTLGELVEAALSHERECHS